MKYLKMLVVFCVLALFAVPAHALLIEPDDAILSGNETGVPQIFAAIEAEGIVLGEELYKADSDDGTVSGPLAGSYLTEFSPSTDPYNALIEWVEGPSIVGGDQVYALVKDGNATPAWYLFDLTALGWDGMEDLYFEGFWEGVRGSISHVALYGTPTAVPEPATMLLLGFGLIGLAVAGRRNFRK